MIQQLPRFLKRKVKSTKIYHKYCTQREINKLKKSHLDLLNFGCGPNPLKDFTNIDGGDGVNYQAPNLSGVIRLDAFTALESIPNNCTSCVTSEHFFEHFTRQDGHKLLREWLRILKPGGILRIVMPDLYHEVLIYLDQDPVCNWETNILPHRQKILKDTTQNYARLIPGEDLTRAININNSMHMDGHKFLYDYETIHQSLVLAGFTMISRCKFGESRHSELKNVDMHDGGDTGKSWVPNICLIVEAQKPVI